MTVAISGPEQAFLSLWGWLAPELPQPVREFRFSAPRRYRFDFAWPQQKVAVEIEGGVWTRGRHVRAAGYTADTDKYNLAVTLGWSVIRIVSTRLETDPYGQIELVRKALAVSKPAAAEPQGGPHAH